MSNEPYSRIVVNAAGNIVMIAHLDFVSQYDSPSFTVPGCVNADMSREEYETAATVDGLSGSFPPLDGAALDTSAGAGVLLPEGEEPPAEPPQPDPNKVQLRSMLVLAQSKLDAVVASDYIAAIDAHIAQIDAAIAQDAEPPVPGDPAPIPGEIP